MGKFGMLFNAHQISDVQGQTLAVRPSHAQPSRNVARSAVCSAQKEGKFLGKALTAAALAAVLSFGAVEQAKADVSGLTPCSQSKGFQKRQKNEIKGLQKRLKQVARLFRRFKMSLFVPMLCTDPAYELLLSSKIKLSSAD